ncbi:MAG TPA: 1-acyl-sn-glycerol-3-phosphate acyltransferase, partial [Phnomibacter sp.]|nr:1-acyl-sn-glycerol-3-phosphate acyltransferase [Phnomibacter sp.]
PVYYLARGDVFRHAFIRKLLAVMKMLPVYRIRDGREKLGLNEETFEKSRWVLSRGDILLVFVEGFCLHQTTLQLPLKKGAPRVIDACWRQGVPVRILPVWLRYSSFVHHPKEIEVRLGEVISPAGDEIKYEPPVVWQAINERTATALRALEHQPDKPFGKRIPVGGVLLFLPAMLGAVLHAPLYLPARAIVRYATRDNVHYDSSLFATLLLTYPLYLITIGSAVAVAVSWHWFFFPVLVLPLLARAYVVWKP